MGTQWQYAGLDQMSEPELLVELYRLADAFERLNQAVAHAAQRQRFSKDSQEGIRAAQDEQALMADMNRLMDRRRAVEGHLMRVHGQLRPLRLDELVEG